MFMLRKKSSLTLFAFALACGAPSVYAYTALPAQENLSVFLPRLQPGFEFNITALALKPGASNLNYVIYNKELPAQSPTWTEKELRPGYAAAFALGARYIFPAARDINLSWIHLNSTTTAAVATPSIDFFLGPDYEIGPAALNIRDAAGKAQFKYDVVNLDVGQWVNFGEQVAMRFFGGLSNTYLREQVDATYSGRTITGDFQGPFKTNQEVTSDFTGLGPRVGIAGNYNMANGFGFLGEAAISALIGSSYAKTTYTSSAQQLEALYHQNINHQFIKDQNVTQVIPGLDAKLGVNYKQRLQNGMVLTVQGGYQAAVYVNAINQFIPGSLVLGTPISTGGIFVATMRHTQSNYSVQGPFLEAMLQI